MRLVFAISFVLLCRCGKSFGSDFLAGFLARRASAVYYPKLLPKTKTRLTEERRRKVVDVGAERGE